MIILFTLLTAIALAIDPFFTALTTAFFDKKHNNASITRLVVFNFLIVVSGLAIGAMIGLFFQKTWSEHAVWYAATSLFALSLKQFYSGFTLNKTRQKANPYHKAELISLSILQGINAFFAGVASGLIDLPLNLYFAVSGTILLALFSGYILGIGRKKLPKVRTDFITGALYITLAILMVIL